MKRPILYYLLLMLLMLATIKGAIAQSNYFVPPSPSAISMIKAANPDVNLYTGKADISIPLYTVKEGSISSSIGIKYIGGSGIKVQEIAGECGLGWALSAGAVITRSIRGKEDRGGAPVSSLKSGPGSLEFEKILTSGGRFPEGIYDLNPDVFNSTVGGRIIFDGSTPYFMNEQGFKIKQDGLLNADKTWIIVDPQGNEYVFGSTADSRTNSFGNGQGFVLNAWYLTQIKSPNGSSIYFKYEKSGNNVGYPYYQRLDIKYSPVSFSALLNNPLSPSYVRYDPNAGTVYYGGEEIHLSSISTSTATVNFSYIPRQDFAGSYAISAIKIFDKNGLLHKKYDFEMAYFTGERSKFASADTKIPIRLKLKSIKENNQLITTFTYNEQENLPGQDSYKFDHWGYYNNNPDGDNPYDGYFLSRGADRSASLARSQANILTGIQWPTGGVTQYNYELNTYRMAGRDYLGGGLRISSISNSAGVRDLLTTRYQYVNDQLITSGLLHSNVNPVNGYTSVYEYKDYYDQRTGLTGASATKEYSLPITKALDIDGIQIGYSQVSVLYPDQSKEVYKFQDYNAFPDLAAAGSYSFDASSNSLPNFSTVGGDSRRFNFFSPNAIQRGQVKEKLVFNSDNKKLKSTSYKYNTFSGIKIPGCEIIEYAMDSFGYYGYDLSQAFGRNFDLEVVYFKNFKYFKNFSYYHEQVMSSRLTEVTETDYDAVSQQALNSNTVNYEYKNAPYPWLLAKQSQTRSDGADLKELYKYPFDFSDPVIYGKMVGKNIITPVIEKTVTLGPGDKPVLLTRTNYGDFSSLLLPQSIEVKNGDYPIEVKQLFNKYDNRGNLLEQEQPNGIKTSYVWSYDHPIAQIVNAGSNEIAIANFGKQEGNGGWQYYNENSVKPDVSNPENGIYDLYGGLPLSRPGLKSDKVYEVKYKYRTNANVILAADNQQVTPVLSPAVNGWIQAKCLISNATYVGLSGSGEIDELSISPVDAVLTTYTYKPLVGMTSETDTKGVTTYYEYDDFGRLTIIRNSNKEILKKNNYYYQGPKEYFPVISKVYSNKELNSEFLKENCPDGYYSYTPIPYTVKAGEYTSMVSQEDADALALAALKQNGQWNANNKGSCTLITDVYVLEPKWTKQFYETSGKYYYHTLYYYATTADSEIFCNFKSNDLDKDIAIDLRSRVHYLYDPLNSNMSLAPDGYYSRKFTILGEELMGITLIYKLFQGKVVEILRCGADGDGRKIGPLN